MKHGKMKRAVCLLLSVWMSLSFFTAAFAADPNEIPALKAKFLDGVGPEIDGLSVDYVYYAPENPQGKLPLVVYFHGAGQGAAPRAQIEENNFPLWAGDEIQRRFTGGGAYLLAMRSREENGDYWNDAYVVSVKAAIDDFISAHAETVDLLAVLHHLLAEVAGVGQ